MKTNFRRALLAAGTLVMAIVLTSPASAQFYRQTKLVSDIAGTAAITDPQLINPWGVSHSPTSPFWVSDAGTSVATLYSVNPTTGAVTKVGLTVNIPAPPSGNLFNGTSTDFIVTSGSASGGAAFIFAGLNGTISGWNPGVPPPPPSTQAILAATGAPAPAAYTGIAVGVRAAGHFLYLANNAAGRIDVFDHTFTQTVLPGTFTDPTLPAGNNPFNIVNIGGSLFVSYTGATGVINVFDTEGTFVKRFATGGTLINPWGMVVAPPDFGAFSNALLVGNFNHGDPTNGPGHINAFNASTGEFLGLLKGTDGSPLAIDGLWTLIFGNGGSAGDPKVLFFSAGIENEAHGLFGSLATCQGPVISGASATPNVLWPPNHMLVPVAIDYTVSDDCDAAPVCELSVSSNEGAGGGSGNTSPDFQVVDAHSVDLRAERAGTGDGRVYTVTIDCKDSLPLSSSKAVTVTVPHDQRH
jgi:uncharacterized protein (TIGR03118 family)